MTNIFEKKSQPMADFFKNNGYLCTKNLIIIMKSLKTIIVATCLAMGMTAAADNYTYLTISQNQGETSYTVSSIDKITFDATDMVISMTNGSTERLPLSGLSTMFFANDPAGMAAVGVSPASQITISDGTLRVTVGRGEKFTLYNIKGEAIYSSAADATVDLKNLRQGVYIVKVGNESLKVMTR